MFSMMMCSLISNMAWSRTDWTGCCSRSEPCLTAMRFTPVMVQRMPGTMVKWFISASARSMRAVIDIGGVEGKIGVASGLVFAKNGENSTSQENGFTWGAEKYFLRFLD